MPAGVEWESTYEEELFETLAADFGLHPPPAEQEPHPTLEEYVDDAPPVIFKLHFYDPLLSFS